MLNLIAKYHSLILWSLLFFNSCQSNQSFRNQKYTRLHLIEANTQSVLPQDSVHSADLIDQSVQFSRQIQHKSTTNTSQNFEDDTLSNQYEQTVQEINDAIAAKLPIVVLCSTGRFLVQDPYYDTLTNLLCGVYINDFKLNTASTTFLELDYSESHCSDINKNCIQVKKIKSLNKPAVITSSGFTLTNMEQAIIETIDQGMRIYLITPKGDYIVHEPNLDTARNVLKGRFVKISNERITPNLSLTLDKKGQKQIDSGYIHLSTIHNSQDSNTNKAEEKSAGEKRKIGRNAVLAIFFFLGSLFYIYLGISIGAEVKNEFLRQILYTLFFLTAGILLVLALVCLLLVLQ